jgi:hypothetical protein
MLARRVLVMLLVLHMGLLVYMYVPEFGVCDTYTLPKQRYVDDEQAVRERLTTAAQFNVLSAFEVVLMACVVVAGTMLPARERFPGFVLVLPGLILVGVISVRMRHTGLLGCAAGDTQCCANMVCLDYPFTSTPSAIGCGRDAPLSSSIPIQWFNRTSYCTIPAWYSTNPFAVSLCNGLRRSPDTSACYQYGCSSVATPIPYYGVRLIMLNAILFAVVACRA